MNKFTVGIFGIIFNSKNEVLLCHRRDYDLWNLPGGKLEKGETPWDGLKREIKEETGLNIKKPKLAGIYSKPNKNEIIFSFTCKIASGKITTTDEADEIKYFNIKNLPLNIPPKQVERIKDTVNNPDRVVFKKQTGKSSIEMIKKGEL